MSQKQNGSSIKDLPAFKNLSEKSFQDFLGKCKKLSFTMGQPISHKGILGQNIFLILEGNARLISEENKQLQKSRKERTSFIFGKLYQNFK